MKALVSHTPGTAETLQFGELPDPVPRPGDLLVKVAAVSLNYPDALMIEDLYQFKPPRPFATGAEIAGVVVGMGEEVTGFKVGDRVCGICGYGGLAELATLDAWRASIIPEAMGFDIAATMNMTYGTSIHGLIDRGELKAGQTLLVLGAAGGIGLSAVELGKALGARVVGAVSSAEKREVVLAAGADEVIIYPSGPLDKAGSRAMADAFKAACPKGYDVIYDPVGGDYAEPALRAIGWEGRYAVIGFTAGIPKIALNLTLLKACSIVGVFWGVWAGLNRERFHEEMAMLFRFWSEGRIKALISERFAFADAPKALARMSGRGAIGKLVVMLDE
jgi:NADPH2:quinone reductase